MKRHAYSPNALSRQGLCSYMEFDSQGVSKSCLNFESDDVHMAEEAEKVNKDNPSATPSSRSKATGELDAAQPAVELGELLADLQAWIEFKLDGEIKYRQGEQPGPIRNGHTFIEIPEWEIRQKLDSIQKAQTAIPLILKSVNAHDALVEAARLLDRLDWVVGYELTPDNMLDLDKALTATRAALALATGKGEEGNQNAKG